MKKPAWFKILEARRNVAYAVTLPFLVGGLREPIGSVVKSESGAFEEFSALLNAVREQTPALFSVLIKECEDLKQPVIALSYKQEPYSHIWGPRLNQPTGLQISKQYLPAGEASLDEVPELLWSRCRDAILTGRFSFRNGAYEAFSADEVRFIQMALGQEEEADA